MNKDASHYISCQHNCLCDFSYWHNCIQVCKCERELLAISRFSLFTFQWFPLAFVYSEFIFWKQVHENITVCVTTFTHQGDDENYRVCDWPICKWTDRLMKQGFLVGIQQKYQGLSRLKTIFLWPQHHPRQMAMKITLTSCSNRSW